MIVCIDIGGGTTRLAFSEDSQNFRKIVKFDTLISIDDQFQRLIEEIKKSSQDPEIIVIGIAGFIDRKKGTLISWGQRHAWKGQSILKRFSENFPNTKLLIENDANLAALGEACFGAGVKHSLVAYLTLSSGVGGGLVLNKKIAPYFFGFEPGHQIINTEEKRLWNCGQRGCFEAYGSGTAFAKIFGIKPGDCQDPKTWEAYAKLLAPGIVNTLVFWSPEILILGGGVSKKFANFSEPLINEIRNLLPNFEIPQISPAKLPEPALLGGLAFSKQK